MAQEFPRTRRIGEQMRRDLAELIRSEIDDPRMAMVSITSIEVSRDLAHAKIYVTYLGEPGARTDIIAGLNHAATALRRELAGRMRLRTMPRLAFSYDEVVERGARLSALIDRAVADDAARHQEPDQD
ncbi:MAG: 30S ribosome-binding factor RbfA [Gammaproteobacteria bacterium]